MEIYGIRHDWPEKAGFTIDRPVGRTDYTFLHFCAPVRVLADGQRVAARPGACILYAPGQPQWFQAETDLVHNWVHLDAACGGAVARYGIPENRLLYPRGPEFLSELFRLAEAAWFSEQPYRQELLEAYMTEFLIRFSQSLGQEPGPAAVSRREREQFRALRQTILSAPEERWTVKRMAELACLSPSRFHSVYRALFGTSPMQDVIEARVRRAQSVLRSDGETSVAALAEQLGYSDVYHFIRQFRRAAGQTPGAYRRAGR